MASVPFTIDIHKGPDAQRETKDLEAAFARRAMMLVRRLLGDERLTELLREETTASNEYWRKVSAESNGEWRASRIVLSPRGLTSKDFINWFLPQEGGNRPEPEKIAAHPEHWVICASKESKESKSMSVLETLGDKLTLFSLVFGASAADFVDDNPRYSTKMTGRGYIEGGTQIVELYHQFRDHGDGQGFDADLAIYLPAACEDDLIECHRQHLLVEFSNWSKQAYEASKLV